MNDEFEDDFEPEPKSKGLNVEEALKLLQPNGPLSKSLKGFEPRVPQQQMMRNIIEAYNNRTIALIEAGTGTGKSVAYLIPAMLWAIQHGERTVISTNTITLQEQLIQKDIPFLSKALKIDVKAVLVKGMSNYICLRKLEDARQELPLYTYDEANEIERIEAWKSNTRDGSKSDLPFVPTATTWEKVCAEHDTCNHKDCPYYDDCHYFKARRQANEAHILVVNHHLLFADLAVRAAENNYDKPSVLPVYSRVILDEAHHIEDIATDYFASKITRLGIYRTLMRLASDKQGKIVALKAKIEEHAGKEPGKEWVALHGRLNIDMAGQRENIIIGLNNTFQAYATFIDVLQNLVRSDDSQNDENKLRLVNSHKTHPHWNERIIPETKYLIDAILRYVVSLSGLEKDLAIFPNEKFQEQTKGIRFDIQALATRLANACETLKNFTSNEIPATSVRWIESQFMRSMTNIHLVDAELDVAKRLSEFLFKKFPTIILCSATLTTNRQFNFIRRRLGLTSEFCGERDIGEHIYDSPFNYEKQALFAIPTDIPNPLQSNFTVDAAEKIWQSIQASRGNAFVLFTSYSMLQTCYQLIKARLEEHKYVVLKQGDENRQALLTRFRNTERSVLFGTDSFWEGVDVVGDALRCVIIVKLPFKVPSEPIIQARTEAILAKGGDPFMEYSLPNAIVKFKQGFGRLIRNKQDRGCVVCLDSRILSKGYGKQFLNSLPNCKQVFAESGSLQQQMAEFYKQTYYLVKKS